MKNQKTILIDKRKKEDIVETIRKNAASYTPEWIFETRGDSDIGATIGQIYAEQIASNINRMNQTIDRYQMEFVNLLDISVHPPSPSEAIVIMNTIQDTIPGVHVEKGARLLATPSEAEGDENEAGRDYEDSIIFETSESVYITSAVIDTMFMVDREDGSIIPLLGRIDTPELLNPVRNEELPESEAEAEENTGLDISEDEAEAEEPLDNRIRSFILFGEKSEIVQNALMIYHSNMFLGEGNNIFIRFDGAPELVKDLRSGRKKFLYPSKGELVPVENVRMISENEFCLVKNGEEDLQKVDNGIYSLIAIKCDETVVEDVATDRITLSAWGEPKSPDYVSDGSTDMDVSSFPIFGETLGIYNECYIGCESYFSMIDSRVTISFDMEFGEREEILTAVETEMELKTIRKRPRVETNEVFVNVYANQIKIEYYNGIGWKKLPLDRELAYIFADAVSGRVEVSFVVPSDFKSTTVDSYEGRVIRIQLLKADNCYMRPAIHHYPIIKNMQLSFSYSDRYRDPEKLISFYGTKRLDLTSRVKKGEPFSAFRKTGYDSDALYLGFNVKPESGPVKLFIELEENRKYLPIGCYIEYSTPMGFKHLKAMDETDSMTKSGIITFMPPRDFVLKSLEGKKKYWIRIRRINVSNDGMENLPMIKNITLNGVRVRNIDTRMEDDYYIEKPEPGMTFNLNYRDILDADVWVNEKDILTESQMMDIMEQKQEKVRIEYDIQGGIAGFYILWKETERLGSSNEKRVYELNRLTGELIFGDGVNTYIPRNVSGTAMKVRVRLCDGSRGNVPKGAITTHLTNLVFVDGIYNPVKSYGGYDMETVDNALIRGANIISTRRRLVSTADYISEIKSYSEQIDQVVCIKGYNSNGKREEGAITFILLLKDYEAGSYSFHLIEEKLRQHLLTKCEMTLPENKLYISEPVFVRLSVICWLKAKRMQDTYEIKSSIVGALKSYFNPLSCADNGWKIGTLPSVSQVQMVVDSYKTEAAIDNITVIARYIDTNGNHEVHLGELEPTPFMVCVAGEQSIHVQI